MTVELVGTAVFAACHCEQSEAISDFPRFEIAAACFAGLAMTTHKIKCHGALGLVLGYGPDTGRKTIDKAIRYYRIS